MSMHEWEGGTFADLASHEHIGAKPGDQFGTPGFAQKLAPEVRKSLCDVLPQTIPVGADILVAWDNKIVYYLAETGAIMTAPVHEVEGLQTPYEVTRVKSLQEAVDLIPHL